MSKDEKARVPHIVIVGAGLGGISTAIALKKQLGFDNFTICERADRPGGTWRDTTYPGCGSDVPGHWYSLSSELNPYWSTYYVEQPELQAYWEGLFHKYQLKERTRFNVNVLSSEWDEALQKYHVVLEDVLTGAKSQIQAEVLIYAIGGFMSPLFPIGMDTSKFRGITWHSARWRHDVDLKGKRVGVIGNGCSAAQFVPRLASDPSVQVINFCRTPQWFVPRPNLRYPSWVKWIFAHLPFVLRWYRNSIFLRADLAYLIFQKSHSLLGALARWAMTRYIKRIAPKDQVDKLVPKYSPGCKRLIVDPGYLACLHQPNVTVKWDGVDCVVEEGIKLKTGEIIPLDIIIFGTGYSLEPVGLKVRGRKTDIHFYYAAKGGPEAYLGSTTPGFPNLFTILGPNVASGHASVVFSEEVQIDMAMKFIKPVINGEVKSFEIKEQVANDYNAWLQRALSNTVWTDCHSYYQVQGKGKNIATFPGPIAMQWWLAKTDKWDNWIVVGGEKWAERRKVRKVMWTTLLFAAAAAAWYTQFHRIRGYL